MSTGRARLVAPVVTGSLALVLYVCTLAPDLLWSDSAKHCIYVAKGEVLGFGFGRHPLHTLVGMAFARLPFPLPYTQNLLSAVAGAIGIALITAAGMRVAAPLAAALAALALAVSQTYWHYSVVNETYSLFWALLAAVLLLALRVRERPRRALDLALLALVSGLAVSAHGLAALALPGLWLLAAPPSRPLAPWRWAAAAVALAIGSSLVWLPSLLPSAIAAREELGVRASLFEHVRLFLEVDKLPREIAAYPVYFGYQFPGIAFLAALLGARIMWRGRRRELACLAVAATPLVVFAASYFRQRQFAMLGATYLLLVPLIAAGLGRILAPPHRRWTTTRWTPLVALALLSSPVLTYWWASSLVSDHGWLPTSVRTLPYRDEASFFLWPPKQDAVGARRYVEMARSSLPTGATVITDFNPGEALRYAVEIERSLDLRLLPVVDDIIREAGNPAVRLRPILDAELERGREVYLADSYEPYYAVVQLRAWFDLRAVGPFVEVRHRRWQQTTDTAH